ncbi:putative pectinesterase/pectinesterase inhibitor 47 [Asimina triloba]
MEDPYACVPAQPRLGSNNEPRFEWSKQISSSNASRNVLEEVSNKVLVKDNVTVAKDGSGNFSSVGDAVAFAPNNTQAGEGYFVILIREGVYEENVLVAKNKKYLMLIGDGINRTVISGNRSVVDGWTTFNSATVAVTGERFVAIDITFKNTAGPEKHQAVAVRNNADLSTFYRCSFEGYQDTLYAHSLRQFYRDCDIYGTVDFIFGNAASVFQNCNILARKPMSGQKIAVTAQGRTDPSQSTGISIHNCTVRAAPDLAENLNFSRSYLGRPWKEYSRTVYMQSFIDGLIDPAGWLEWNGTVGLSTLFYGEFDNYGPGANRSGRVQWPGYSMMNASQALNFTVYNFTMGDEWVLSGVIPFSSGLL